MNIIAQAIERFDRAVRSHAWRGGGHPADAPYINEEYRRAKRFLVESIEKALAKKGSDE